MKKAISLKIFIIISFLNIYSQEDKHAFFIKSIYDHTLEKAQCDHWLSYLSDSIGGRLAGSEGAAQAVEYTFKELQSLGYGERFWKQECQVPRWERGETEEVIMTYSNEKGSFKKHLNALALGNTIGTGDNGISAQVIEVKNLDTLELLGQNEIAGKIVFFNRPMSSRHINTMYAYGEAVDQRVHGASRASKYGAVAVLVRSMTNQLDDIPHTGVQSYQADIKPIPSIAISTNDAEVLSETLKSHNVEVFIKNNARMLSDTTSYNVIAEIKGSEFPNEIILVGGHLDSWDVGGGAHDDGSGCVHAMQVFETLKSLGYQPKRTLRCVLFMNEENGLGGGKAYAEASNKNGEFHLAALESDSGGFTPRGFTCTANAEVFNAYLAKFQQFDTFLDPYDLYLKAGGGGADIGPLKSQKGLLIGFKPDNQRYFDFHHTKEDVFKNVNIRELRLGAAAITSLIYLIDQHGLK